MNPLIEVLKSEMDEYLTQTASRVPAVPLDDMPDVEAWLPRVRGAQQMVQRLTHAHYSAYRAEEVEYWSHIARWLWLLSKVRQHNALHILDIGCAYGTLSAYCRDLFPSAKIQLVDCVSTYLDPAVSHVISPDLAVQFANVELEPLSQPSTGYDVVLLTEVLEHFNFEPTTTLKRIRDYMNREGMLFLSTPMLGSGWSQGRYTQWFDAPKVPTDDAPVQWIDDHMHVYSWPELTYVLASSGFQIFAKAFSHRSSGAKHFNLLLMRDDAQTFTQKTYRIK